MRTCRTYFFNEDGSAEQDSEFFRGQFVGRFDTCQIGEAHYNLNKTYNFHVGHGVFHTYRCVAIDAQAALMQRADPPSHQ